jgi:hypothetical protein
MKKNKEIENFLDEKVSKTGLSRRDAIKLMGI